MRGATWSLVDGLVDLGGPAIGVASEPAEADVGAVLLEFGQRLEFLLDHGDHLGGEPPTDVMGLCPPSHQMGEGAHGSGSVDLQEALETSLFLQEEPERAIAIENGRPESALCLTRRVKNEHGVLHGGWSGREGVSRTSKPTQKTLSRQSCCWSV